VRAKPLGFPYTGIERHGFSYKTILAVLDESAKEFRENRIFPAETFRVELDADHEVRSGRALDRFDYPVGGDSRDAKAFACLQYRLVVRRVHGQSGPEEDISQARRPYDGDLMFRVPVTDGGRAFARDVADERSPERDVKKLCAFAQAEQRLSRAPGRANEGYFEQVAFPVNMARMPREAAGDIGGDVTAAGKDKTVERLHQPASIADAVCRGKNGRCSASVGNGAYVIGEDADFRRVFGAVAAGDAY